LPPASPPFPTSDASEPTPDDGGDALPVAGLPPPDLTCYRLEPDAPRIVPGVPGRAWMEATQDRFAFRCTPLTIANASGWELLSPVSFQAFWDGGPGLEAITIASDEDPARVARFVVSHFGAGVLTFHTGHLFRTPPGWALWCRGSPNTVKDAIVPLDGLVETDWLPFTFTMNWRFTRRRTVRFARGEPFCFVSLFPHGAVDAVAPVLADIAEAPELKAAHDAWARERASFNERLWQREAGAVEQGWEKRYVRGASDAAGASPFHRSKRRLRSPKPASG